MFWKTTTKIKAKSPTCQQKTGTFTVPHSPFQLPFNHLKPKCVIMIFSLFPHVSSLFPHCFFKFLSCYPHFSPWNPHFSPFFLGFSQPPQVPQVPKAPHHPHPHQLHGRLPLVQQLEDRAAAAVLRDDAQRTRVQADAVELNLGAERRLPSGYVKIAMENHDF